MRSEDVFALGLGLTPPWVISKVEFVQEPDKSKTLHIYIDFRKGGEFVNDAGQKQKAYDTEDKTWRHLNFFQHECYLHCRVPRIIMSNGKYKMVEVPWARPKSGFTLLFEAYMMILVESEMPVAGVSKTVKETAPRIWRIFRHWVSKSRAAIDLSAVRRIGVDETSSRKGHTSPNS